MWYVSGVNLQMTEDDWGIVLPVTVNGLTLGENDSLKFTFKTSKNGETILEKSFHGIDENTVELELSESDSAKFPVGVYAYGLDWYQSGSFLCNIIPSATFKVVDKV